MFGPLNIGQSVEEARENAIRALETVSLVDKKEENPYDLSLSERKLVSIASILSMNTGHCHFRRTHHCPRLVGQNKDQKTCSRLS